MLHPDSYHDKHYLVNLLDGEQCGETLQELFKTAEQPESIVVNLVEQYAPQDTYCLETYCKAAGGVDVIDLDEYHNGQFQATPNVDAMKKCPRIDQIRVVRIHDNGAMGPPWARALGRKNIGNEEFCLHTATYSSFVTHWDTKVRKEWLLANNEFAVISNRPKPEATSTQDNAVPRTCGIDFLQEEKLPEYDPHPEGMVEKLKKPLLGHSWTPGFSFSKCHLEEAAPSDGFIPFVSTSIEAFARYARMWTRGYDVYTPTQNIIYRKKVVPNPHKEEWIENWKGRKTLVLKQSLKRIRSYLEITGVADDEATAERLDNLGIYGLGKRRSLKQLNEFVGIDLATQESRSLDTPCVNFEWVPYDSSISPMDNLYSNPDDLDPQPEFPLRSNLTFAYEYGSSMMDLDDDMSQPSSSSLADSIAVDPLDSSRVPYGTIFILWMLGICFWCHIHVFSSTHGSASSQRRKNKNK